jgi:hypothetical protein
MRELGTESRGRRLLGVLMGALPPKRYKGEQVPVSIRLPKDMLADLEKIAKGASYTRVEVIQHFLSWAIDEYQTTKKDFDEEKRR